VKSENTGIHRFEKARKMCSGYDFFLRDKILKTSRVTEVVQSRTAPVYAVSGGLNAER
jgi:hypothetical protein